jgi:hypothetical protein
LIAEVEMAEEPEWGIRRGEKGINALAKLEDSLARGNFRHSGWSLLPPVLIRPDGYVAWVGDLTQRGLADALTSWFGPPAAA